MDILLMFIIIVRIKIRRVRKMQYFVYNNTEEKRVILPSLLPSLNDEIWPTISTPMKMTFVAHHFHWLTISPASSVSVRYSVILPSLLPSLNDVIWPTISTPMKTTFVAHHFH